MDIGIKRNQEQALIGEMIALYCKKNHGASTLCADCSELKAYAEARSARCPYMETKTFCSNCKTHCYKPEMREKIRAVMRFSGPRIIFRHPVLVIKHAYYSRSKTNEATKV
ncbi:MAG: nitrous oxide-stimulated promoter family protein [Christensenellales bacterium]|jgi:hypothetical protein